MIVTDSRARWQRAVEITAPVNAGPNPGAGLGSVACIRTGFCVAVGGYLTAANHELAMRVAEVKGHWSRAIQVKPPSNAGSGVSQSSYLGWVTCIAGHSCVAVGDYVTTVADREAMAVALPLP